MKTYLRLLLTLCLCSVLSLCLVSMGASTYIAYNESLVMKQVMASNVDMTVPALMGSGMGLDTLYNLDKRDIDTQNIYILGNSQSLLGLETEAFESSLEVNLVNASMGSATLDSYILMNQYLAINHQEPQEEDIVILDLSYALFQNRPLSTNVTASALSFAGIYTVSEDLRVYKDSLTPLRQFIALKAHAIGESVKMLIEQLTAGTVTGLYKIPAMTPEGLEKTLNLDALNTMRLLEIIEDYNRQGLTVIIEVLYQSEVFKQSQAGIDFNEYIDGLLLELDEYIILDNRNIMTDSDFVDMNHLNYEGRLKYTQLMIQLLKGAL